MHSSVTLGVAGVIRPQAATIGEAVDAWAANMRRLGCKPRSIDRFVKKARECAAFNDWTLVTHLTLEGAEKWLAHKRDTAAWSGPTHDQACSILRCFSGFLKQRKMIPEHVLEHLESSGEQGDEGSRALRTDEARRIIAEAIRRRYADARARGNVPAFLLFLCHTGLRHDEASRCCWKDVDLDSEVPAIYTDPKWSKNGKRMRVVLNSEIVAVLKWHRTLVQKAPDARVFPIAPNRHTWQKIREAAKVDDEDQRGRAATYHSCRKWFATELDRAGASPGVVSRLLRHAGSLAEQRYIDPDPSMEIAAVSKLPRLWPENENKILNFSLENHAPIADTAYVTLETRQHEEIAAPGRDAGMRASQLGPGSCLGPSSFRVPNGSHGLDIEHENGHFHALVARNLESFQTSEVVDGKAGYEQSVQLVRRGLEGDEGVDGRLDPERERDLIDHNVHHRDGGKGRQASAGREVAHDRQRSGEDIHKEHQRRVETPQDYLTLSWCLPESVTEAARACGADTRGDAGAASEARPGHHERPSTRSGIDAAPGSATQRPGAPSHDRWDEAAIPSFERAYWCWDSGPHGITLAGATPAPSASVRAGLLDGSSVSYAKRDTDHPVGDGAEQRRQVRSDAIEVSPGFAAAEPGHLPSLAAATHAMVGAALPLCSTEGRALGSGEYGGSHPPMRFDSATSDREKRPAGVEPGHRVTLTPHAAGPLVHVDPAPPSYDPIAFTRYCMSQAENAQRQGRNRLMRKWMRASAAVLIAAGTSIAALRPTDGYWCYLYHCSLAKSVSECILCCFAFCYPPSQLESECQDACTGGMSRMEVQNLVVYELAQRVVRVSAATTNEHAETVSMMIGAAMCNDEVIARRVMVMANDLPLECDRNEVRAAYERRHGEQGDI